MDPVTNEQLYAELRHIRGRVDRLDDTIRGNNGEGLVARLAVMRAHTDSHTTAIGRAHSRVDDLEKVVARLDRRFVFFCGCAAAIGAVAPSIGQAILARLFGG